jgi:hypothetical protein
MHGILGRFFASALLAVASLSSSVSAQILTATVPNVTFASAQQAGIRL